MSGVDPRIQMLAETFVDRVLGTSAQPCGCDVAAGWTCAEHPDRADLHNTLTLRLANAIQLAVDDECEAIRKELVSSIAHAERDRGRRTRRAEGSPVIPPGFDQLPYEVGFYGRSWHPVDLLKICPSRSLVRFHESPAPFGHRQTTHVPNHAIRRADTKVPLAEGSR